LSAQLPRVLRLSPNPLAQQRERHELQRLFGRAVEIIDYPQQASRDTGSVAAFARAHDAEAVFVAYYNEHERAALVRALAITPVLTGTHHDEEVRDRFGTKTTQRVWDGIGQADERGRTHRVDAGALSTRSECKRNDGEAT
jgi:hypothetical protein